MDNEKSILDGIDLGVEPDDIKIEDGGVNPEYDGMQTRSDKICEDGEGLNPDSYKRYIATYDITVFIDNNTNETVTLEGASCIFLAKTNALARIMCLGELVKQSQYEFVSIKDAIFKSLVCIDTNEEVK